MTNAGQKILFLGRPACRVKRKSVYFYSQVYSYALLDEEVIPNFRHCDCAPGSGAGKRSQVNSPAEGVLLPQQFRHPRPREYVLFGLYIELAMQLQQFNRHVTLPLVYLYVT